MTVLEIDCSGSSRLFWKVENVLDGENVLDPDCFAGRAAALPGSPR